MKYTYQCVSESGSFAPPYPDDIAHADGERELIAALEYWTGQHRRVGSDMNDASLWVCHGTHDSIEYPDFIAYPRIGKYRITGIRKVIA